VADYRLKPQQIDTL